MLTIPSLSTQSALFLFLFSRNSFQVFLLIPCPKPVVVVVAAEEVEEAVVVLQGKKKGDVQSVFVQGYLYPGRLPFVLEADMLLTEALAVPVDLCRASSPAAYLRLHSSI